MKIFFCIKDEFQSLALTAEFMGIDSENPLFLHIPAQLAKNRLRSVYNRCKRRLANEINEVRIKLAKSFNESEKYFIIDKIPIEVCKLFRAGISKIC